MYKSHSICSVNTLKCVKHNWAQLGTRKKFLKNELNWRQVYCITLKNRFIFTIAISLGSKLQNYTCVRNFCTVCAIVYNEWHWHIDEIGWHKLEYEYEPVLPHLHGEISAVDYFNIHGTWG